MKTLLSFVIVAALLPVLIFGAAMKDRLYLSASADANPALRIWFEPSNVILAPGQQVEVRVMAESDAVKKLASNIRLRLLTTEYLSVENPEVVFEDAFVGKNQIGLIVVSGEGELNVDAANSSTVPADFVLQTSKLVVLQK